VRNLGYKKVATRVRMNAPAPVTAVVGEAFCELKSRWWRVLAGGVVTTLTGVILGGININITPIRLNGLWWLFSCAVASWCLIFGVRLMGRASEGLGNNARCLIGDDRLQYLTGDSHVAGQVPYDNIATIRLVRLTGCPAFLPPIS